MTKKTKRKTKRKIRKKITFWQKYKKIFYIIIIASLAIFLIYSSFNMIKSLFLEKKSEKKVYLNQKLLNKMNKMLEEERKKVDILKKELNKKKSLEKKSNVVVKQENSKKTVSSEVVDYKKSLENYKTTNTPKDNNTLFVKSKKPLLAIIIDDVAFSNEVKKIKALPFKVTPSFFPPTKRHPDTPKLAGQFSFYMVHLPLQAFHYPHPEPHTLLVSDTQKTINDRIKNIKKWFPRDKFLNNHTGSKFTSDYDAMTRLYKALDKNSIVFIDSRTSAKTVALKVADTFNKKLLSRDIFLDNIADIAYIQNQLKKAVKKAKAKGFAIAIGHPHPKTLQALEESKNLLKDVKLVYVSTIYKALVSQKHK